MGKAMEMKVESNALKAVNNTVNIFENYIEHIIGVLSKLMIKEEMQKLCWRSDHPNI